MKCPKFISGTHCLVLSRRKYHNCYFLNVVVLCSNDWYLQIKYENIFVKLLHFLLIIFPLSLFPLTFVSLISKRGNSQLENDFLSLETIEHNLQSLLVVLTHTNCWSRLPRKTFCSVTLPQRLRKNSSRFKNYSTYLL